MAKPYIMPLGFIDRITRDETVFLLTNPEDSKTIGAGTPVTVWRYSQEYLALGKVRGLIDQRQLVLPVATTIFAGHMW